MISWMTATSVSGNCCCAFSALQLFADLPSEQFLFASVEAGLLALIKTDLLASVKTGFLAVLIAFPVERPHVFFLVI